MKRFLPLFLLLFVITAKSKADCNPSFTATIQGATVQVQAANTAPHLLHRWNFSGAHLFGPSSAYTYYVPGTYTITHLVIDSINHCEDSVQQIVTANFQITCTAGFAAIRDTLQLNRYYFNNTSFVNGGASYIYINEWTVNGVLVPNYPSSFNTILPIGTNTTCLTVYAIGGCTSSVCHSITITDTSTCNWSASFTTTAAATNPKRISFTPTPLLGRIKYNWSFGDGFSSTIKTPEHTYNQAGTYDVRLYMWDTVTHCHDTLLQTIQVHGLPSDSCTVSFTSTINPSQSNQVSFTAISNQTITSQTWWINDWTNPYDSIFLTNANPTYTFPDTGYYSVCLYITTSTGCSKFFCNSIYISQVGGRLAGTIPSFPNPATNTVGVSIQLPQATRIGITVYNSSGNAVYGLEKQGSAGNNTISIPVQQLRPGQYYIDINYGGQRKRSLFQKM